MKNNYYWSDDWSSEFYIALAKAGFISTTYDTKGGLVLLPELQYEYAILDFKDLHISSKVKKLINKNNFIFSMNTRFQEVLQKISLQHTDNWLKEKYVELLNKLYLNYNEENNFKLISVELVCKNSGILISGEVGYIIGKTYTSLSGFSSKEKAHSNYGSLQMVLLGRYLQAQSFAFWNFGHPHMQYKQNLGCKIYSRDEFLKRWNLMSVL